ncbi:MAG: methionine biosynthesis protein MetW [archaeon]
MEKLNQKPELKSLDQDFLKKFSKYDFKEARKKLREVYGMFWIKKRSKIKKLVEEKRLLELLKAHRSTAERLDFYPLFLEMIPNNSKILDLGCGFNPIAFFYFNKKIDLTASDISQEDLELIKKINPKIKIMKLDLTKDYFKIKEKYDIILLLKLLDVIEAQERNISEKIILHLLKHSKKLIVSFSTKSLGGRKTIRVIKRTWFEKLLKKNKINYSIKEFSNEIFYVLGL